MFKHTIGCGLLAILMGACNPGGGDDAGVETGTTNHAFTAGRVTGSVTDDMGTRSGGLGGASTLSVTTSVQIVSLVNDGTTAVLASGAINNANGSYTIDVPAHDGLLIAQAIDASNNVLASAILEQQTSATSTVAVQPINTESSLEASVLIDMVARGGVHIDAVDLEDLRARIDSRTAAAVRESSALAPTGLTVNVHALASAMAAAQASTTLSLAAHSVDMVQYRSAETMLAATLNGQLAAGGTAAATQANAQFMSGIDQLNTQFGMSAEVSAATELRSSAEVRLVVPAMTSDATVSNAAIRAAAVREGRFSANAMVSIATRGSASTDSLTSLQLMNNTLQNSLDASVDATTAGAAFLTWRNSLHTWFTTSNNLLASVNATLGGALEGNAVDSIYALSLTLDANLTTNLHASLMGTSPLDAVGFATSVDATYNGFRNSVNTQVTASLTGIASSDAELFGSAMVFAAGSFH